MNVRGTKNAKCRTATTKLTWKKSDLKPTYKIIFQNKKYSIRHWNLGDLIHMLWFVWGFLYFNRWTFDIPSFSIIVCPASSSVWSLDIFYRWSLDPDAGFYTAARKFCVEPERIRPSVFSLWVFRGFQPCWWVKVWAVTVDVALVSSSTFPLLPNELQRFFLAPDKTGLFTLFISACLYLCSMMLFSLMHSDLMWGCLSTGGRSELVSGPIRAHPGPTLCHGSGSMPHGSLLPKESWKYELIRRKAAWDFWMLKFKIRWV